MSQSSIILKFLCSRLLFCYMKCNHFTVFPHTASVSLTAGLHVLSQLLFFLSEILLCDIASPWFQSYFFLFLYFRTELGECAHMLSDHQCLHLSLCYRFLTGRSKTTSNKRKVKIDWNDCEHNLICTFSKDECGILTEYCVCVCVVWMCVMIFQY